MRKRTVLIMLAIFFSSTACMEEIIMTSNERLPATVYCILTDDPVQTLSLYQVRQKNKNDTIPVAANSILLRTINIEEKTGETKIDTVTFFLRDSGSVWKADFTPDYGRSYILEIDLTNGEHLHASTRFPDNLKIQRHHSKWIALDEYTSTTMCSYEILKYNWLTRPNVWHMIDGVPAVEPYTGSCNLWILPNRMMFNYNSSDFVTDHPGVDPANLCEKTFSDFIYFRKDSLLKYNLLDNGWRFEMEYFRTMYYAPDTHAHRGYIHIHHPEHFNNGISKEDLEEKTTYLSNREFNVTGDFSIYQQLSLAYGYNYRWIFVSNEYDKFLEDIYDKYLNKDNLLSVYDTDNVYTNIDGGTGIFGAKVEYIGRGIWMDSMFDAIN